MPMTFHVSLVDWAELRKALRVEHTIEELVELAPGEDTDFDHCSWQWDFMEQLEEIVERWPTAPVRKLERLFGALFSAVSDEDVRIMELELPPHLIPIQFESAWSPPTVAEFAALWTGVRFEDLRPYFRRRTPDERGSETFEEFRAFAEFFAGVIVRGAQSGRGLIVFVHG